MDWSLPSKIKIGHILNTVKIYFKLFSQRLRLPENKPWISHKEALNINEVIVGYGERKYTNPFSTKYE